MDELNYLRKSLVYNIEIENDAKVLTIHMIDKDDSKPLVNQNTLDTLQSTNKSNGSHEYLQQLNYKSPMQTRKLSEEQKDELQKSSNNAQHNRAKSMPTNKFLQFNFKQQQYVHSKTPSNFSLQQQQVKYGHSLEIFQSQDFIQFQEVNLNSSNSDQKNSQFLEDIREEDQNYLLNSENNCKEIKEPSYKNILNISLHQEQDQIQQFQHNNYFGKHLEQLNVESKEIKYSQVQEMSSQMFDFSTIKNDNNESVQNLSDQKIQNFSTLLSKNKNYSSSSSSFSHKNEKMKPDNLFENIFQNKKYYQKQNFKFSKDIDDFQQIDSRLTTEHFDHDSQKIVNGHSFQNGENNISRITHQVVSPKNQRYSDDKNKKSFKFIFEPKSPTNSFKENSIFSSKNFDQIESESQLSSRKSPQNQNLKYFSKKNNSNSDQKVKQLNDQNHKTSNQYSERKNIPQQIFISEKESRKNDKDQKGKMTLSDIFYCPWKEIQDDCLKIMETIFFDQEKEQFSQEFLFSEDTFQKVLQKKISSEQNLLSTIKKNQNQNSYKNLQFTNSSIQVSPSQKNLISQKNSLSSIQKNANYKQIVKSNLTKISQSDNSPSNKQSQVFKFSKPTLKDNKNKTDNRQFENFLQKVLKSKQ